MDEELEEMLENLKPEIKCKCEEIRNKKSEKRKSILFILCVLLFLFVPCFAILLNISMMYIVLVTATIFALLLLLSFPKILKSDIMEVQYE